MDFTEAIYSRGGDGWTEASLADVPSGLDVSHPLKFPIHLQGQPQTKPNRRTNVWSCLPIKQTILVLETQNDNSSSGTLRLLVIHIPFTSGPLTREVRGMFSVIALWPNHWAMVSSEVLESLGTYWLSECPLECTCALRQYHTVLYPGKWNGAPCGSCFQNRWGNRASRRGNARGAVTKSIPFHFSHYSFPSHAHHSTIQLNLILSGLELRLGTPPTTILLAIRVPTCTGFFSCLLEDQHNNWLPFAMDEINSFS